jgi:uncharacterized linocin/CFP29 family protein
MEYENNPNQWTEDQWNLVQQTVRDEASRVRVAASFLPRHGPLSSEIDSVPIQAFNNNEANPLGPPNIRLAVDDRTTRPLTTISVNVHIRNSQMAQPDLSSALSMFRRAANIIGRIEDGLIFGGQGTANTFPNLPQVFTLTGQARWRGLIGTAIVLGNQHSYPGTAGGYSPDAFVRDITQMISRLEGGGYLGPFALILGNDLFELAHTPTNSLVMPTDRIKPIINGPLLRSSTILPDRGILISLAGDPLDLVLASDISVKFIQVTMEPRHLYRVSQRFTLRIKQPGTLRAIVPE